MMADWNYSHLSVHSFDIFTKAVAQPGGRDATIISQDQPESAQMIFKKPQSLLKIFPSKLKQARAGVNREHGRHTHEYPYGMLTCSSRRRKYSGLERR